MGTEQEKIAIDCCSGLGQKAGELPADHYCYTTTEVERIISRVMVRFETDNSSRMIASYGKIIASPSRMNDPDKIHLFHESGEAGDFNRSEFNEAISEAAERFFHENF